jgi:Ras-related GTP-binding protein A/B
VSLISNVSALHRHLESFAKIMDADEVVLFERATFLVISHSTSKDSAAHRDPHRFEKISNIIKQFKLACSKSTAQFSNMEVRNERFSAFIDYFTTNTYVMVVLSDASIRKLSLLATFTHTHTHTHTHTSARARVCSPALY